MRLCYCAHEGTGDQKHCYGLARKIKLADKGQNLERLGKHLKLFTDKLEVSDTLSLAECISRARKRIDASV